MSNKNVTYLFFDTETTGLPKSWKAPVTDLANWPRLVQLAYLLYDENGCQLAAGDYIIKPDGFVIPAESALIHGISTERAIQEGEELSTVLRDFQVLIEDASYLVAHNINFDEKIIGAELLRNKMIDSVSSKNKICTMQSSINFCAIKGPYGNKWPKLSELHQRLFGTDFGNAHNAAADIEATARCFWELKKIGEI